MPLMLILAMQVASPATPLPGKIDVLPRCEDAAEGEVLVCGARADRFRLPLPSEREPVIETDHRATTGLAALTPPTRCGMFEGERRCGRREAERYGYGRGRDPITLLGRIGAALLDPDAETSGP